MLGMKTAAKSPVCLFRLITMVMQALPKGGGGGGGDFRTVSGAPSLSGPGKGLASKTQPK